MTKRIVFLTILIILTLGVSLCSAESWEQVDANSWVDVNSTQVDSNGIIKAAAREYKPDNMYYSMAVLIDKTNGKYCFEKIELYNITGKRYGETKHDPADRTLWIRYGDNDRLILRIIERTGVNS